LDVFKLGWLGKTSIYSKAIIDTLLKRKQEGKIWSIGTSNHDRKRAGRLALCSERDQADSRMIQNKNIHSREK
jgi:predicted aldo/keto reductase-like oxidoreductase